MYRSHRQLPRVAPVVARSVAIIAILAFQGACSDSEPTDPTQIVGRDSTVAQTIEISFSQLRADSLLVFDTITVNAVVRDLRGNEVIGGDLVWKLESAPQNFSPLGRAPGTIASTGSRSALVTTGAGPVVVEASTRDATLFGRAVLTALQRRARGFVWTAGSGLTEIPRPSFVIALMPTAVNDAGEVVGSMEVSAGGLHRAFLWSLSRGLVDLGTATGYGSSKAHAVNKFGTVTGYTDSNSEAENLTAFVWTRESGMALLPTDGRPKTSIGKSINSAGEVAGEIWGENGPSGFRWAGETGVSVLPPGAGSSADARPVAINDAGQILGSHGTGQDSFPGAFDRAPVIWDASGKRSEITICSGPCRLEAVALNNRGQVAGSRDGQAFIWSAASGVTVVPSIASLDRALAMNDLGHVVGVSTPVNGQPARAWFWSGTGPVIDLGLLPRTRAARATGINNNGQVVGYAM